MTKKDTYNTYGAALSPAGLTLYCYNSRLTTIEEMVTLEDRALRMAVQRQWRLFNKMQDFYSGEEFIIGLN